MVPRIAFEKVAVKQLEKLRSLQSTRTHLFSLKYILLACRTADFDQRDTVRAVMVSTSMPETL